MTPTDKDTVPGFRVWWPAGGRDEEDAIFYPSEMRFAVHMQTFQEAAEHYAENHCDPAAVTVGNDVEVFVRDTLTRAVRAVTVRVDYAPMYKAVIWRVIE